MPFITMHKGAIRRLIELEKETREKPNDTWADAYRHGFVDALRVLFPSESVGMMIVEVDIAPDQNEEYQNE